MDDLFFHPKPWFNLFQTDFPALRRQHNIQLHYIDSSVNHHDSPGASPIASEHDPHPPKPSIPFLSLPAEVIASILSFLEPEQLCTLAQVSTQFLRHVYDPRNWRRIAHRTWPKESTAQLERHLVTYKNWRRLSTLRPRIRTNAVFVVRHQFAKTSSQTATEEPVAPVFLVTYYRFLRFYSDGTVVSLTSAEQPHIAVKRVRRGWRPASHERDKAAPTVGRFTFDEQCLSVSIELPMRHPKFPRMRTGTVYMDLALGTSKDGAWDRLALTNHYAIMDHDGGDLVSYNTNSVTSKPFRLISLWGFRTIVYREFPQDDLQDLAQWFEMKKAARAARQREMDGQLGLVG